MTLDRKSHISWEFSAEMWFKCNWTEKGVKLDHNALNSSHPYPKLKGNYLSIVLRLPKKNQLL